MKSLGIIANCGKDRSADVLKGIVLKAEQLGLDVVVDTDAGDLLDDVRVASSYDEMFDTVDVVIAVGGDGTMLRAARELDGRDKPLMGFNIGALGFMTSVAEEKFEKALECLASDDLTYSERSLAACVVERDGKEIGRYRALNDILVGRGPSARVITLDMSINGDRVTSYLCDGLIVSTPTGSTGHSLSTGGPILVPDTQAFVITLICPHTLSSRPMVVPDSGEIVIRAVESANDLLLTVDGQVDQSLQQGDLIKIRRSEKGVRFIHLPGHSYFSVLRQKLRWRGSNI
jgi:NAD+ kinase